MTTVPRCPYWCRTQQADLGRQSMSRYVHYTNGVVQDRRQDVHRAALLQLSFTSLNAINRHNSQGRPFEICRSAQDCLVMCYSALSAKGRRTKVRSQRTCELRSRRVRSVNRFIFNRLEPDKCRDLHCLAPDLALSIAAQICAAHRSLQSV